MEPEIAEIPVVPEEAVVAQEEIVAAIEPEPVMGGSRLSSKTKHVLVSVGVVALTFAIMTSFVYRHDPTDSSVRKIVGVIPYPIAVVGNQVITYGEYLEERDALNAYFVSTAAQNGTDSPDEEVIAKGILDTMAHKIVVADMAKNDGIELDSAKVDEFYANALGGADPAAFEAQLQTMFGWTPDQFRSRVVEPVVLATQVGETLGADESLQSEAKQKAQAAYDRVASGEDFGKVATDASSDPSATAGGDVGSIKLAEIPEEWRESVSALKPGDYSGVVEGQGYFMVFKVAERTGKDADESVKLALISVAKKTLEDVIQEYLASHRNWRAIGNT